MKKISSIKERDDFIGALCSDESTDWEGVLNDIVRESDVRDMNLYDMEVTGVCLYMLGDFAGVTMTALGTVISGEPSTLLGLLAHLVMLGADPSELRAAIAEQFAKENDKENEDA